MACAASRLLTLLDMFEDTKGVFRIRKSAKRDRQNSDQKTKQIETKDKQ